jgi:hypothetical protein
MYIYAKGLISRIYKELQKLKCKKNQITQFKMDNSIKETFLKRRNSSGQQVYKKMLSSTNH